MVLFITVEYLGEVWIIMGYVGYLKFEVFIGYRGGDIKEGSWVMSLLFRS